MAIIKFNAEQKWGKGGRRQWVAQPGQLLLAGRVRYVRERACAGVGLGVYNYERPSGALLLGAAEEAGAGVKSNPDFRYSYSNSCLFN